jgi:hypothetical protein
VSYFEGALFVRDLQSACTVPSDDDDFMAFVVITSETDHMPAAKAQQYWATEALERLKPELAATELWAKGVASGACEHLIARFGEHDA